MFPAEFPGIGSTPELDNQKKMDGWLHRINNASIKCQSTLRVNIINIILTWTSEQVYHKLRQIYLEQIVHVCVP